MPGPRVPRPRDPRVDLENRPLYSSTSHHLRLRAWTSFLAWCARSLSFDPVESFVSCPALLAMVLRSFGRYLYQRGGSLQTYRYAILAAQRLTWSIRGHLGPAWELATRWERLQPVQHRTPIPEAVVQALVVLAWAKGYRRWAGVTLLAFYGLARIGEVLKCERSHLLLPSDHLSELQVVFLKLEKAKSSSRGGALVQHLRVDDDLAVQLIAAVYSPFQIGDRLYPFGPAGGSVADIQWRMRLQHQQTLGYYLQEVAALNSILDAGEDARHLLFSAAKIFPFLCASSRR